MLQPLSVNTAVSSIDVKLTLNATAVFGVLVQCTRNQVTRSDRATCQYTAMQSVRTWYLVPHNAQGTCMNFRADFIHNRGGAHATKGENSGFGKVSSRSFHGRISRRLHSPHCRENRLGNLSKGVCHLACYTGIYSGPPFPPSSLYSYTIYSCISNRNDGQNAENCDTDKRRFVSWLTVRAEKRRKAYHVTGQCVQRNGERRIKLRVKGDYMLAEKTEKCS